MMGCGSVVLLFSIRWMSVKHLSMACQIHQASCNFSALAACVLFISFLLLFSVCLLLSSSVVFCYLSGWNGGAHLFILQGPYESIPEVLHLSGRHWCPAGHPSLPVRVSALEDQTISKSRKCAMNFWIVFQTCPKF